MPAADDKSAKGKARPDALATTAGDAAHAETIDSGSNPPGLAATVQSGSGNTIASPGAIPTVIAERYRVGARLGRGGFGAVYEAIDQRIDKKVAVKILDEQRARSEAGIKQFRSEALAASRLRHPGIIAVSDYDLLPDGRPFLVMEFAVGETLDAVIRRGPLDADRAVQIAGDLAAALEVAHKAGVIHRDLKPGNVMVEDGAVVPIKILDFGIAKLAEPGQSGHVTDASQMAGTPHYMAPEQIRDSIGKIGPHTDVYALGACVYEMLAGKPPFAHITNVAELLLAQLGDPPPPLPTSVPAHVTAAVMRALEKDASKRFANARDFAAALRGGVVETTGSHVPVAAAARSRRPLAIALGGLVIAGGAAAAFVMTRGDGEPKAVKPDAAVIAKAVPAVDAGPTLEWSGPWQQGVTEEQRRTAENLLKLGNQLLTDQRFEDALPLFREALASWDHPALHYQVAIALLGLDRPEEAYPELDLALKYGGAGLDGKAHAQAQEYLSQRDLTPDAGPAVAPKKPPKKPPKRGSDDKLPDSPHTNFRVPK